MKNIVEHKPFKPVFKLVAKTVEVSQGSGLVEIISREEGQKRLTEYAKSCENNDSQEI